jgi:hypothetical protein
MNKPGRLFTRTQHVSVGITRTVRRLEEELRNVQPVNGGEFAALLRSVRSTTSKWIFDSLSRTERVASRPATASMTTPTVDAFPNGRICHPTAIDGAAQ